MRERKNIFYFFNLAIFFNLSVLTKYLNGFCAIDMITDGVSFMNALARLQPKFLSGIYFVFSL